MPNVIEPGELVTTAMEARGVETHTYITTTLYDLTTTIQDVVDPNNDTLVVTTVAHLLRSGRLTWLRTDHARHCQSRGEKNPAPPVEPLLPKMRQLPLFMLPGEEEFFSVAYVIGSAKSLSQ